MQNFCNIRQQKKMATKKDKIATASLWIGIAGFMVGIIGIVINFFLKFYKMNEKLCGST